MDSVEPTLRSESCERRDRTRKSGEQVGVALVVHYDRDVFGSFFLVFSFDQIDENSSRMLSWKEFLRAAQAASIRRYRRYATPTISSQLPSKRTRVS